jgi:hypothetical protein
MDGSRFIVKILYDNDNITSYTLLGLLIWVKKLNLSKTKKRASDFQLLVDGNFCLTEDALTTLNQHTEKRMFFVFKTNHIYVDISLSTNDTFPPFLL